MDANGNITQIRTWDFNNLGTLARTHINTYLGNSTYTAKHIRNRLDVAQVNGSGQAFTTQTNRYDDQTAYEDCPNRGPLVTQTGMRQHDTANYGSGMTTRGNISTVERPWSMSCFTHDMLGNMTKGSDVSGHFTDLTPSSVTNFAVSSVVAPNGNSSLATSNVYKPFLGVTSTTGPNSATSQATYDTAGRPATMTSAQGAVTTRGYQDTLLTRTSVVNNRTAKTESAVAK